MTSTGLAVAIKREQSDVCCWFQKLTGWSVATGKRITDESLVANTERDVVPNSAVCILATETRARINALLGSACQLHRTVRVELTLRTAIGRLTDHASLA